MWGTEITPPFGMIVGLDRGWNISYRRNLQEGEFEDWLALMDLLSTVTPTTSRDKWTWNLDKNGNFSSKSLATDLDTNGQETNSSLFNAIWTDFYPKRSNSFGGKLDTTLSTQTIKSRGTTCTHCPFAPMLPPLLLRL
ncbi:choline-phosphate cytidylyltransferase [Cucumis melo var. makuwa]|uniref:Choline-phosphate cytidylyltransferase n=1 Tax=Cucumis melo var. makuwa TaxID=1194695 RepID=A0A5A7T1C2_CUCMM|nr:choline-phosphate cytidylyltransferase [Cucumis melo var. makuwa]TYK07580.1 choline-phosphate cytidylyltransferase [Cucumis melo var. makuwa]